MFAKLEEKDFIGYWCREDSKYRKAMDPRVDMLSVLLTLLCPTEIQQKYPNAEKSVVIIVLGETLWNPKGNI